MTDKWPATMSAIIIWLAEVLQEGDYFYKAKAKIVSRSMKTVTQM